MLQKHNNIVGSSGGEVCYFLRGEVWSMLLSMYSATSMLYLCSLWQWGLLDIGPTQER